MRHSFPTRAAMALLMLISAGASAFAQQAQAPQYACYVPGSGTIYRIKEPKTPAQCAAGHTEFQLAAGTKPSSGPTGPAGGDLGGTYPDPLVMKLQGHPVLNAAGAFDFSNPNGFVSAASLADNGPIPATGGGRRLMWYPAKAALRAGEVNSTEWDAANVGSGSIALGTNPIASASASTAMGFFSKATGVASVAIGFEVNAQGSSSVALGNMSTASGEAATAIGVSAVASGDFSMALGNYASTNGKKGAFVYGDGSSGLAANAIADNQFVARAQRFWLGTNNAVTATAGRFLETSTGAYLTSGGAWTNSSDVNLKHAFASVDADSVLDRIATMPVQTWSYKAEADSVRHMGPTAQDFRKAFGLGDTDKAIATVDADGVSLAAIKALIQRTATLRSENNELRAALADLSRRIAELEMARR